MSQLTTPTPSKVKQFTVYNYLDPYGTHLVRVVRTESGLLIIGVDICRVLQLAPGVLRGKGKQVELVRGTVLVALSLDEAAQLARRAEVLNGKRLAVPFAMWLQKEIFPLAVVPGRLEAEDDEEEEDDITTITTTAEPVAMTAGVARDRNLPVPVQAPTNTPTIFEHQQFGNLRVIMDETTGEPWFVGNELCAILGLEAPRTSLSSLDHDERSTVHTMFSRNNSSGLRKDTVLVSEFGLYSLILRSRKPEARQFKRWVTHDVLPAIRKHGGYLTPALTADALLDPDVIINLATALKEERLAKAAAEAKLARTRTELNDAAPKAALVDATFARTAPAKGKPKLFKLHDVARKLNGVNTMAIHRDLERLRVFFRRKAGYKVYSQYRDSHFVEKWDEFTGRNTIFATVKGAALIAGLHKEGLLTKRGEQS